MRHLNSRRLGGKKILRAITAVAASVVTYAGVRGADFTWDNGATNAGGGDNVWTNGSNWTTGRNRDGSN